MINGERLWLNLASGTDIKDGWVNLDVTAWPAARRPPDILWDARKDPLPFPDNSADQIYAGYLLLHLAPGFHAAVLKEIHRVLVPKTGRAVFGEVDMDTVMRRWLLDPSDMKLAELIWGEQGDRPGGGTAHGQEFADFDKHCHGFTPWSLERTLTQADFVILGQMRVHAPEVFYELTLACGKVGRCLTSP